jgi:2-keto-4-pentenoate hydratase/2-oxohepta-3-ene-1,7-dioic acid hydratase in catechol pathway
MTRSALATITVAGAARAALVIDERVALLDDLVGAQPDAALPQGATVLGLLENWEANLPAIDALAEAASGLGVDWRAAAEVHFRAPVDRPRQIFCTGANYRTHVVHLTVDTKTGPEGLEGDELREWAEKMMDDRLANGDPYVFTKPITTVAGPNDDLVLPANTTKPDWELELAVIIGKGGYQITREAAMEHVAGYAIANDISARDLIPRTDYKLLGTDWLRSKGQLGFLPLGPYFVPARFVPNPYDLGMRLSVAGKLMQNETTGDMMFDIVRQIEYIARYTPLLPGDVICTGSPAGNGTHYNRFLTDGDLMVGEIDGLGSQRINCRAPA